MDTTKHHRTEIREPRVDPQRADELARLERACEEAKAEARRLAEELSRERAVVDALVAAGYSNGNGDRHTGASAEPLPNLTRRELEVLTLMNEGYNREPLAQRLRISVRTYDNHTASIRAKLAAPSNLAALAAARAAGVVESVNGR